MAGSGGYSLGIEINEGRTDMKNSIEFVMLLNEQFQRVGVLIFDSENQTSDSMYHIKCHRHRLDGTGVRESDTDYFALMYNDSGEICERFPVPVCSIEYSMQTQISDLLRGEL